MRHVSFLLAGIAFVFFACTNTDQKTTKQPEPQVITQSRHSAAFNQSVQSALATYYNLAEAFVNWDSVAATSLAAELKTGLDRVRLDELAKEAGADTMKANGYMAGAKKDLDGINTAKDITTKRYALNSFTDNLYQFLNAVKYDREKLYLQECPMAFNDAESGVWLSAADSIRNPYLGLHHPRYGKGMLECGDNKEVLNYTGSK